MEELLKKLEASAKANSLEIMQPLWDCGIEKVLRAEEYAKSAYASRKSEAEKLAMIKALRVLLDNYEFEAETTEQLKTILGAVTK